MNKFDLIHIGHGKCLSTMLQNRWQRSTDYEFFHGLGLGNKLSESYFSGIPVEQAASLSITLNPLKRNVLSYECFTFYGSATDTPAETHHLTLERQEYIAKALSHLSDQALMILRDPMAWITSCHAQYAKYGGTLSLQRYFEAFRRPLLDNLRLDRILDIWQGCRFEILLLPMEEYQTAPDTFWGNYSSATGLSAPEDTETDSLADNKTEKEKVEPMVVVNGIMDLIVRAAEKNPHLRRHAKTFEAFQLFHANVQKWSVRRAIEIMSAEELDELKSALNLAPTTGFRRLEIDNEARTFLERHYLTPLEAFPAFQPFLSDYRSNLFRVKDAA